MIVAQTMPIGSIHGGGWGTIFERPITNYNLRYTEYHGYVDSKYYTNVKDT